MNRLIKYLERNNISFYSQFLGDSYFNIDYKIPVLFIELEYSDYSYSEAQAIIKGIKRYINRYCKDLEIEYRYSCFSLSYSIVKKADKTQYNDYFALRDNCIALWEKTFHELQDMKQTESIFLPVYEATKKEVIKLLAC